MTRRLEPDPDLENLVRSLNAKAQAEVPSAEPDGPGAEEPAAAGPAAPRWRLPEAREEDRERLNELLVRARETLASDLLLVAGAPAVVRVNGRLERLGSQSLSGDATARLCAALVPAGRRGGAESDGSLDFSSRRGGAGRFRCNVHRERGGWSAAIRLFPAEAPEIEALHLPAGLARFAELEYGLVLVTGPTGCGKSTTLAALLRRILTRRRVHLVTIEDPVEYEHDHGQSVVEHIEIGRDVAGFAPALRSVLRQDPDVLLIGEMRDTESMSIAITAAETGHLVFSTLHTANSPQTIYRILDSYPANQMDAVRAQLSASLAGIVSQQLVPRSDGRGRVPAVEILVATPAVRNLVRKGKIEQLRSQLTLERAAGMLDLDRSLADLVHEGLVTAEEARARARAPEDFELMLRQTRSKHRGR